ncbi:patatin-like phospholipase family protein [Cognatilysobacter lacus]|uniref:Patatin-like phospholipase family protein n=1 Tax=Cognatilysobacter lacus TaxID=1643323 RepID=A0A5D8YRK0_9GAMM|nr:patatin-like phospholipase family protein [Lysobacter lacus]TZF85418.1 patatin-like phospholipase family protein [Lysobacter lacus]
MSVLRTALLASLATLLAACGGDVRPSAEAVNPRIVAAAPKPIRIGLALGGGAAKGFAHIGVIKMLEANGIRIDVVSGTSAGSVVGSLYASGMDAFALQKQAVALDEDRIKDVHLFSGGVVQGLALQDYVNESVGGRTIEKLGKPFAAVSTRLEDGQRTVFTRGNTGQAVRASSSIPGVFEPVPIGKYHFIDGGIVSPVPVDAARQLGADFVIAVDISSKAPGTAPGSLLGTVNQSITIMGQKLGAQELARADVVIRPTVNGVGPAQFDQKQAVIMEGERAAVAALPQIRAKLAQMRLSRQPRVPVSARPHCEPSRMDRVLNREPSCD